MNETEVKAYREIRKEDFELGLQTARKQILDYIQQHLEEGVDITSEDIASEIEYLQRQDIREKNNG
jgi:predicted peroxiredoxin